MHVLVYFVEEVESPLTEELGRLRDDRRRRNLALAERLASLGLPLTYDQVVAEAGGEEGVGRPHFAAALVASGAAHSIDDAFDRYLAHGRPGYVTKGRLDGAEVARLARLSGGVAVLAHPYSMGIDGPDLARVVGDLAAAGFAGIEAVYGRYSPRQRQSLGNLARRFDLIPTGGSDYHGRIKPDLEVGTGRGDLRVADTVLQQLSSRRPEP
jgi:predicted metal-dependent phosphoesterase TrpH